MFLEHLGRVVKRFGLEIHAYVLMPNHFHLLVRSVRGNISESMKQLLGPYSQALNQKHGWDGPVFRGRFKNQLVSESEHLRVVIPYIHLNPVRGRLVAAPRFAMWSSYTAYVGETEKPEWLTTDAVMSLYHTVENLVAETRGFHTGELKWPSDFDLRKGMFRSWSPDVPRTPAEKATFKQRQLRHVQYVHSVVTNLDWDAVKLTVRGRSGNPGRRLAVWLLTTWTDLTHREVGEAVGASANQVALVLHSLRKERFGPQMKKWMRRAEFWLAEDRPQPGKTTANGAKKAKGKGPDP